MQGENSCQAQAEGSMAGYLGCRVLGLDDGPQLGHLLPLRRIAVADMAVALRLLVTAIHAFASIDLSLFRLIRREATVAGMWSGGGLIL